MSKANRGDCLLFILWLWNVNYLYVFFFLTLVYGCVSSRYCYCLSSAHDYMGVLEYHMLLNWCVFYQFAWWVWIILTCWHLFCRARTSLQLLPISLPTTILIYCDTYNNLLLVDIKNFLYLNSFFVIYLITIL